MSRLDQHICSVRNKLSLGVFIDAWAVTLLFTAAAVLVYAILRQTTGVMVPKEPIALGALILISAGIAAWLTARRRPDELATAVAIDVRLGLQEKFSTALHARHLDDPFSKAALLDAEQTAAGVDLHRKFPIRWPQTLWPVLIVALLAAALLGLIEPHHLFASNTSAAAIDANAAARSQAKDNINRAIAAIDAAPKPVVDKANLQIAKAELQDLAKKPDLDPSTGNRKALSAMQQLQKATEQQQQDPTAEEARRNQQQMAGMKPDEKEAGGVADAHRDLAKSQFNSASQKLGEAVKDFDKMSADQKSAAAKQMQNLADQLKQAASDPQKEQRQQEQMQRLGMNPQQQQQAQQLLKQAAKGDAKASAQLQQLAKQSVQQLNKGQPPTQQQQQQAQQSLQQMQAQSTSQQQREQLQQDAQKMAQAMQKSADQSDAAGSKVAQGQKGQGSQSQQQSQQMQDAMADAQQQMQKMQAASQDAKQSAEAGKDAAQASADAQSAINGGQPSATPQPGGPAQSNTTGGGTASVGHGNAQVLAHPPVSDVNATVNKAVSDSENTDPDHVLASTVIKTDAERGESHAQLQDVAKAAAQQSADEIDSEHVGREGQKVVHDYFGAISDGK